ncbi:MAG: hypothetical protein J1F31_05740 [Erysipelotrichales bacterium]|nr:hypothetical protein [Erysipelotrichales bacterium]
MKKKNSIFVLMIGMVLAICGSCANKTSDNKSVSTSTSISEPTSTPTPSTGETSKSTSTDVSTSTSASTSGSTSSSGTSNNVDTTKYFDVIVNNGTGSQTHVAEGTFVTVVANEPATGKTFSGWRDVEEDRIVSNSSTYTFEVVKDIELTAEYTDLVLHIIVHNGTGTGDYLYGTVITITANEPEKGKSFKLFMDEHGNVLSRNQEFELTVTEDMVITATYETINYTVIVIGGTGGKDYFLYGEECTVTANNIPGKIFVGWENEQGTIVSKNNPYTFNVTSDITLTAKFEDAIVTEKPETYADVVSVISQAALVENNLESLSFKEQLVDQVLDEAKAKNINMVFYKDGVVAEGTGPTYLGQYASAYPLVHAYQIKNGRLYETLDFDYAYASSYEIATAKTMVDNVTNSDLEVLSSDATQIIENYGIINKLAKLLADFDEDSTLNVEDMDGSNYKIILSKVLTKETSALYGTFDLEIVVRSSDNFITSYNYSHKRYVRSSQVEDSTDVNSPLKPNATPRDNIYTIVEASKSPTELENMPSDVVNEKIDSYFISDFTFTGSYYQNNTSRSFTSENPLVAAGFSITSWTMTNVTPSTAIESKTLYFLSSSNEDVITINSNGKGITTIQEGTSDIVVATSTGVSKTVTFTVGQLPPTSITINTTSDKIGIDESVELTATVNPSGSIETVTWSVNDSELAEIITENGKTMLRGKSSGFVTVTATSTANVNVMASKTIFVSAGDLSTDELKETIVGTWQYIFYSNQGFTFTFNDNGTVTIVDTYRGASAKISCNATWELTTKTDDEMLHNGSVTAMNDEYYVIEITNIELTDSPAYYIHDFHLVIAKDGSSLTYHFIPGSDAASTQSGNLTKIN